MARVSTVRSESKKHVIRLGLRALNGSALCGLVGGLLGGILASASALILSLLQGTLTQSTNWWPSLAITSIYGVFPGVPGGALIGMAIVIRNDRKRLLVTMVTGLLTGIAYAALLFDTFYRHVAILACIVSCGLVGGLLMAPFLRLLRRHWKWWTRWEENESRGAEQRSP